MEGWRFLIPRNTAWDDCDYYYEHLGTGSCYDLAAADSPRPIATLELPGGAKHHVYPVPPPRRALGFLADRGA